MSLSLPFPHRHHDMPASPQPQDRIALDPTFVEQTETFLPLDRGVGTVSEIAMKTYAPAKYEERGIAPAEAQERALRVAAALPDLGFEASHTLEPQDFVLTNEGTVHSLNAVNETLEKGQEAEIDTVETSYFGERKNKNVVHVYEPTEEAGKNRLDRLESKAPHGVDAQVALEALAELAQHRPDSMDGSQAAAFLRKIDQDKPQPHVRFG